MLNAVDVLRDWLSPQGIIALGVIIGIIQQFLAWRGARARGTLLLEHSVATTVAVKAVQETQAVTVQAVQAVAQDVKTLEINTNNKVDLLIKTKDAAMQALIGQAAAEGELRGRAVSVSLEPAVAAALVLETAAQVAKDKAAKG